VTGGWPRWALSLLRLLRGGLGWGFTRARPAPVIDAAAANPNPALPAQYRRRGKEATALNGKCSAFPAAVEARYFAGYKAVESKSLGFFAERPAMM